METKYEVLTRLFGEADSAKHLLALSAEEATKYLKDTYQLDFTVDELNDVATGIKDALQDNSDELNGEQLELVTGGGKGSGAYNAGYYIGKTVKVVGTAAGIGGFLIAAGILSW